MNLIQQIAAKRQRLLDGLEENEGDINLQIFEDFCLADASDCQYRSVTSAFRTAVAPLSPVTRYSSRLVVPFGATNRRTISR